MSKMSQLSAEMNEQNIPEDKRNSLIDRVSSGMHAAEKKIDAVKPKEVKKPTVQDADAQIDAETIKLAKKVRAFADRTHNVVTTDGKSYVKVGAYQYLADLVGVVPSFEFDANSTNEEVWCTCILKEPKTGIRVTETTMYANKKEKFLRDKEDFAVLGMAQTRAFVRAMKNVYGFIMELAGYQAVGIEEISLEKENK